MRNFYLICLFAIASINGHGNMVWPPVWQDAGGKIGLSPVGSALIGLQYVFEDDPEKSGSVSMWYTNYTFITGIITFTFTPKKFKKCKVHEFDL